MSTLSNVAARGGETHPPSVRVAPDTIPEARSSNTGVSVRYVPTLDKSWHVFRASYGREDKASDYIVEDCTYVYIAKNNSRKKVNGKSRKVSVPLTPSSLFAYTTKERAEAYLKGTSALSFLSFYLNHFKLDKNHKNPPLTITRREMENFITATCNNSEHLKFVDEEQCHFKGDETVRIIEGMFKGVEGRVAHVSGQQRVVVSISNIGLVSTAYIPLAFIQIIAE